VSFASTHIPPLVLSIVNVQVSLGFRAVFTEKLSSEVVRSAPWTVPTTVAVPPSSWPRSAKLSPGALSVLYSQKLMFEIVPLPAPKKP